MSDRIVPACPGRAVSRFVASPGFARLPLGVGGAFVLRHDRWVTMPAGIVTAASVIVLDGPRDQFRIVG
ncbi:MAG: hypothetical protein CMJ34_10805 [Phycisphaerae bacterium]|nr:hypothetical protein [Phycisphaerae bacterium]